MSGYVWIPHPGRNVTLGMEHTPHVDVAPAVLVENEIRIPIHRPDPEAGQTKLVGITPRTAGRMVSDVTIGVLQ
jgi:hypothetical protein